MTTATRRNFRFDGLRHSFGPYAWVISREMMCRHGFITSFLRSNQEYRGLWTDAAGVSHWQWFATLKDAKKWTRMHATSRWAMK